MKSFALMMLSCASTALAAVSCSGADQTVADNQKIEDDRSTQAQIGAISDEKASETAEVAHRKVSLETRPVTIDDLVEILGPVSFKEADNALIVTPREEQPNGDFFFIPPSGATPNDYRNLAHFVAGKGWNATIFDPSIDVSDLEAIHNVDGCHVFGTVGQRSKELIDFGMANRGSVDGLLLVAFALAEGDVYKKKLPIAIIAGGQDGVIPFQAIGSQRTQWPGQTYILTIQEANHAGYYEGERFEGDGEALVPAAQQRLILGEIAANMTDRFCLTRKSRIAEEERNNTRELD